MCIRDRSEDALKHGVFSMYECVDVYKYQFVAELPSELKCLKTLPVRWKNHYEMLNKIVNDRWETL